MSIFIKFKKHISSLLLRGSILEWWIKSKMDRLERKYVRQLLAESGGAPAPEKPAPIKQGAGIRRILFISDIMWEGRELVPELAKIAEVQTLNLNPSLRTSKDTPAPEIVAQAINEYIRTEGTSSAEPDVILFYARASILSDEAFDLIRKRWSCPLLGLNLDEKLEFLKYDVFRSGNDDYGRWAAKFDLNLSNVRAVVDWYSDRNLPVLYVPEGFHPKLTDPPRAIGDFKYPISFVGSRRPEREMFFRRLRELGMPIEPIGFGWPNSEGGKNPEATYRLSQMNLGIGLAAPSQNLTTLKTRDFECPGSGACYLTTYNWELALHYDIGREILCYRSEEELIEMFSFYRRRPEECLKIAQAAQHRALNEHTWEQRFRMVFRNAGFNV